MATSTDRRYGPHLQKMCGSIIQMSASENRTKETVLIFKLTLTDLRTGLAIWEDEAPVGKRRTKTIFGT